MKEVFILVLTLLYNGDIKFTHYDYSVTMSGYQVTVPIMPHKKGQSGRVRPVHNRIFTSHLSCMTFGEKLKTVIESDPKTTKLKSEEFMGYGFLPPLAPVFFVTPSCEKKMR